MTRVKDHPMDESANPTPRPVPKTATDEKKSKKSKTAEEKNVTGKTDASAFDAKNNNMTRKG